MDARRVAPAEEARQLAGAFGSRLGLVEVAVAQRDRRPDLLGGEGAKRQPRAVCELEELGEVASRRLEVTQRDPRDHPPTDRIVLDLDVAQLVAQGRRLGEHFEDLLERGCAASRVRPREEDRESPPVAEPARHLDGVRETIAARAVVTAVREHAGQGREQHRSGASILHSPRAALASSSSSNAPR